MILEHRGVKELVQGSWLVGGELGLTFLLFHCIGAGAPQAARPAHAEAVRTRAGAS